MSKPPCLGRTGLLLGSDQPTWVCHSTSICRSACHEQSKTTLWISSRSNLSPSLEKRYSSWATRRPGNQWAELGVKSPMRQLGPDQILVHILKNKTTDGARLTMRRLVPSSYGRGRGRDIFYIGDKISVCLERRRLTPLAYVLDVCGS